MSKIFPSNPVPTAAGIGLRSLHVAEMLGRRPSAGWLEVHAENYMGDSPAVESLEILRETYPLSLHEVGLSLGSASGLDGDARPSPRRLQPFVRLTAGRTGRRADPSTQVGRGRYVTKDVAARIRDQALEEAARIADQVADGRDDMLQGLATLGALIAEGIRSLKQCEQSTGSK
jgi:uncharacterized protein